ncbi:hypothetical protein ID866_1196 [Astraeus odoratus]|nr:hypothetical protein ID866_1196 [Astraeus odoratus]
MEKSLNCLVLSPSLSVHQSDQHVPGHYDYSAGQTGPYLEDVERPRVPLIVLAQQGQYQPDYFPDEYVDYGPEMDHDGAFPGFASRASRLSTITELTERTEPSRHRSSRQLLNARASLSTDTTSSYGQVIDRHSLATSAMLHSTPPIDPNEIPPSPSPSAIQRLSIYDSPPSAPPTETASEVQSEATATPRAPSLTVPPVDSIPDIPDSLSKASDVPPPPPPEKDFVPRAQPRKRSKLATLASSRASTISSTRESDLETTSILTYPALRPAPESRLSFLSRATTPRPPSSEASDVSEKTIKGIAPPSSKSSESVRPPSTTVSSMSSHVRRAIQTAMDLEAHDRQASPKTHDRESPLKVHDRDTTPKSQTKTISEVSVSTAKPEVYAPVVAGSVSDSPSRNEPSAKARPQSKLAKLAQAKANAAVPLIPKSIPPTSAVPLPKPHTEYFTPIANGATATTAITTSYQTLHSLSASQMAQSVPLVQMPTSETRQSKLAMKVKKAQIKASSHSSATEDEGSILSPPPLFLPKSSPSRASPSAFASLLLDDPLTSPEAKDRHSKTPRYGREELNLVDVYQASHSQSRTTLESSLEGQSKRSRTKLTSPDLSIRSGFAFDVPSPDDIVYSARRAAKEREKAQRAAQQKKGTSSSGHTTPVSRAMSPVMSSVKSPRKAGGGAQSSKKSMEGTPSRRSSGGFDQKSLDIAALNLTSKEPVRADEPPPKVALDRGKLLEEARKVLQGSGKGDKKSISLVVIGHVDAGKSTLMGRLLYELGHLDEKTRVANERGSSKVGKSSFSWAWGLDGTTEERERCDFAC